MRRTAIISLFILALPVACAADRTWTHKNNDVWGNAANWSNATLPGPGDRAILAGSVSLGLRDVKVQLAQSVDQLHVSALGYQFLTDTAAGSLTIASQLAITADARLQSNLPLLGSFVLQSSDNNVHGFGMHAADVGLHLAHGQSQLLDWRVRGASSQADVVFGVHGAGTDVTYNGQWQSSRDPDWAHLFVMDGARLTFGAQAQINNNRLDLIGARPFVVQGNGNGENGSPNCVLDCAIGFDADHTAYGSGSWTANGLSTLRIGHLRYITRATANLPSIHKKAGGTYQGTHTHHGLLIFDQADGAIWELRDNDQEYDGGIHWSKDWTIDTTAIDGNDSADLKYTGLYHDEARVSLGPQGSTPTTVTKRGPGTWRFDGTQAWRAGSLLLMENGTVVFNTDTDPRLTGWDLPVSQAPAAVRGHKLTLSLSRGAEAQFVKERRALVMPLTNDRPDPVDLDAISLAKAELFAMFFTDGGRITVADEKLVSANTFRVWAGDDAMVHVDGTVRVGVEGGRFQVDGDLHYSGKGLFHVDAAATQQHDGRGDFRLREGLLQVDAPPAQAPAQDLLLLMSGGQLGGHGGVGICRGTGSISPGAVDAAEVGSFALTVLESDDLRYVCDVTDSGNDLLVIEDHCRWTGELQVRLAGNPADGDYTIVQAGGLVSLGAITISGIPAGRDARLVQQSGTIVLRLGTVADGRRINLHMTGRQFNISWQQPGGLSGTDSNQQHYSIDTWTDGLRRSLDTTVEFSHSGPPLGRQFTPPPRPVSN